MVRESCRRLPNALGPGAPGGIVVLVVMAAMLAKALSACMRQRDDYYRQCAKLRCLAPSCATITAANRQPPSALPPCLLP